MGDRARVIQAGDITVVSDCYNANPNSVRAALDSLSGMQGRRVCILGDMLELGPESEQLHRSIGNYAVQCGIELVVGCGELGRLIAEGAIDAGGEALAFDDREQLIEKLREVLRPGDTVLVKASLRMGFKKIVETLTEAWLRSASRGMAYGMYALTEARFTRPRADSPLIRAY